VAELVVAMMFGLARSVPFSDRQLKSKRWERRRGIELAGRTLGLVGCGQIGRIVAELAVGIGMEVRAYDVKPDGAFAPSPRFRYADFDDVLGSADFLSLHCPPPPDGRPLLSAARLAQLKPEAYVINTARAGLIDAAALIEALEAGRLAGAAVDVYEIEPPLDDPLVRHDRVIATPHVGGYTSESVGRAMQAAVSNLLEHLDPVAKRADRR
jgi:phosphoglycerate dehydrogenase-like enzyme